MFTATELLANDSDMDTTDSLSIDSVFNAMNGSVVLNPDGTVTFTPTADFSGAASFDYTVKDGNGGSDTATVTIDVEAVQASDPNATDDVYSTDVNTVVSGNVMVDGVVDGHSSLTSGDVQSAGLTLDFTADSDSSGDSVWSSTGNNRDFTWDFGRNTSPVDTESRYAGITKAYEFDGSRVAQFNDELGNNESLDDLPGNPSNDSASFEIWFKASDVSDNDVLFETGGAKGVALRLDGSVLAFDARDGDRASRLSFDLSDIGVDPTREFVQVVGVINDNANVELYFNGTLAAVDTRGVVSDWAGSGSGGLGGINRGLNFTDGSPGNFEGEIAVMRFYEEALTSEAVADHFQVVAGMSVTSVNGVSLSLDTPIVLENGRLLMSADGSYRYTPNAGFEGVETFDYELTDIAGQTGTATVTINVGDSVAGQSISQSLSNSADMLSLEGRALSMISTIAALNSDHYIDELMISGNDSTSDEALITVNGM